MADMLTTLNKNGSGIDFKSLAANLVLAEYQPRVAAVDAKIARTETSISALGQVRAQIDRLSSAAAGIAAMPTLVARSSAPAIGIEITDPARVEAATTEVYVEAIARRQVIEFTGFAGPDIAPGSGTLTVETGTWTDIAADQFQPDPARGAQSLTIPEGATLSEIATALSALDGVTARVLDKGDGTFSLGIVSEVGAASALRLSVAEDPVTPGLSALDMTTGAATHQIGAAADALLMVDGFVVTRPGNTVDDLIPGTRLTLTAPGEAVLTLGRDRELAASHMQTLTQTMNETLTLLKTLTSRGADGSTRGALAGDLTADAVAAQIRAVMSAQIDGFPGGSVGLADMGVTIERNGSFRFDRAGFDKAFDANPAIFDAAFTDRLESTTPGVTLTGSIRPTQAFGSHSFLRPGGQDGATLDGRSIFGYAVEGGASEFFTFGTELSGATIRVQDGIEEATIYHASSLISKLQVVLEGLVASGGQIATRETQLGAYLSERQDDLATLEAKSATAESRYIERFTAMEVAITQLKNTGDYLTNLVAQWNKSD